MQILPVSGRGDLSSRSMEKAHRTRIVPYDFVSNSPRLLSHLFIALSGQLEALQPLWSSLAASIGAIGEVGLAYVYVADRDCQSRFWSVGHRHGGMHCSEVHIEYVGKMEVV